MAFFFLVAGRMMNPKKLTRIAACLLALLIVAARAWAQQTVDALKALPIPATATPKEMKHTDTAVTVVDMNHIKWKALEPVS
jgi:uncharacterized membrane protein YraQ (UPF0718 family)